jgi:hypothetical protein
MRRDWRILTSSTKFLIGRERRSFGRSFLSDADDSEECEVLQSDGRTNPKAQLPLRMIRVPNSAGKVLEARASEPNPTLVFCSLVRCSEMWDDDGGPPR